MVLENNYKARLKSKLGFGFLMLVATIIVVLFVNSFGIQKYPNTGYIMYLFLLLIILLVILVVYYVIIDYLDLSREPKLIDTSIKRKLQFIRRKRYFSIFSREKFDCYIFPEGWLTGLGVTKEIYDAFSEGDNVEISYLPLSKTLVQIKKVAN